ncbi:MAG TPA: 4-alpha-glucanotransferase, partial [Syntrophales bacterium]|nr:4-alpha-glucanotransferase [Syntrophales bacterium]HOL59446.1 4-alpha-glucanotransferase [Syntrophales bacterium]HPO34628.1 4-alpha-glucanotransferase [Syntrophales bacterium]
MTTITFHLPYFPAFGERISINWQTPSGEGLIAMSYEADDHVWKASLSLSRPPFSLEWHYVIQHPDGREEREGGPKRFLTLEDDATSVNVQVFDFWRPPGDLLSVFTKAPFEETLFARRREASRPIKSSHIPQTVINIPAPAIDPEEGVYLVGEPESLGGWDPAYALPLRPGAYPYWELCLPTPLPNRFAYKYLIGKKEEGKLTWESGPNRIFASPPFTGVTLINDYPLYPPEGPGKWAGVIVPVFSLRSRRGLGVGEFLDLIPFITWARKAGLRIVQLLPINDTQSTGTWSDSYPYAIISTCALHPLYLNLDDLLPVRSPLRRQIRKEKARLHNIPHVDYPEVMRIKRQLLQEIFRLVAPSFLADRKAKAFIEENAAWLKPYAAFSFLRDKMGTGDFAKWGPYARGTPEIISRLNNPRSKHFSHIAFYYFLQYHLYRQLTRVTSHARAQGMVLKGDLPIGLSPASVEIWTHPEWFDQRYTMGAPPDNFSDTGQNWGFPLYDWEEMEKDGFAFWKMRFSHLARFFQCVR